MLLTATPDVTSNLILNGDLISSAGAISLNAANNFVQNGAVNAAQGVAVNAVGSMTFGSAATTVGNPVRYAINGVQVTLPSTVMLPVSNFAATESVTDLIATFSAKFEEALALQDVASSDPLKKRDKDKDGIVVEGNVCSR
jgi:hypothetical protein